jgi:hypothetical protein
MLPPQSKVFSVQRISHLALLTAACIVGRLVFVFIPNVQPMSALLFLVAFSYCLTDALMIALLSLLGTNIYLGMGPWTISQLAALTGTIVLFQQLGKIPIIKKNRILQAFFAFLCLSLRTSLWLDRFVDGGLALSVSFVSCLLPSRTTVRFLSCQWKLRLLFAFMASI